ncbi:MAG TPA: hypothetical protein VEZ70_14415 [Allosphingosinicella sp.]|nr:hypothetical protein [Allosphingosinicella sp.]
MPQTITIQVPTDEEHAAEQMAYAQRVHGSQYAPDAAPDRLEQLIAQAQHREEQERERRLLLEALRDDPDWRLGLLVAGVEMVPLEELRTLGGPNLWEGIDQEQGRAVLRRASAKVKHAGGPEIRFPAAALSPLATQQWPPAPLFSTEG